MAKIFIQRKNTRGVRVSASKKLKPYLNDLLLSFIKTDISEDNAHDRIANYINSNFKCDSNVEFFDGDMISLKTYKADKDFFIDALYKL